MYIHRYIFLSDPPNFTAPTPDLFIMNAGSVCLFHPASVAAVISLSGSSARTVDTILMITGIPQTSALLLQSFQKRPQTAAIFRRIKLLPAISELTDNRRFIRRARGIASANQQLRTEVRSTRGYYRTESHRLGT